MCTWAILVILAAILDLTSKLPHIIILTPETDSSPQISGIRGFTLVSGLHWSKSRNSTNLRWPPDAILNCKKAYPENDRESSGLDSRHLQATFLKKSQLSRFFFPFQSLMLQDYISLLNSLQCTTWLTELLLSETPQSVCCFCWLFKSHCLCSISVCKQPNLLNYHDNGRF